VSLFGFTKTSSQAWTFEVHSNFPIRFVGPHRVGIYDAC
jgi:hypothetical protein